MKKYSIAFFLLALLMLPGVSNAITYNIYQDIIFEEIILCEEQYITEQDNWVGAQVTVNMTHDIFNVPSSPFYASNVNSRGWRYIYYDIFDVDNLGNETFETTIQKYHRILHNGVNSGSSSTTYTLSANDLSQAGVTSGDKVVRLRVKMTLLEMSHEIQGTFLKNGVVECFTNDLDGSSLTCEMGKIECFNYQECNANVSVFGFISLVPIYDRWGNIVGYTNGFTWNANVTGGSGNYTYSWTGDGTPSSGSGSTFNFQFPGNKPEVFLTVTDNETGCVYYWSAGKKAGEEDMIFETAMQIGPNPAGSGSPIKVTMDLEEADTWQVKVFDLQGRLMTNIPEQTTPRGGHYEISLNQSFAPGVYLVQLHTANQGVKTRKLIVQ